nr:immunoglobulin light chain junction region [Macaca mulatta]MOX32228.1 immunoglobulin light chain junction region [Macaca mulatta]MOX32315.1 immunoglobulin light chain junction region [Macaca mulatta]
DYYCQSYDSILRVLF